MHDGLGDLVGNGLAHDVEVGCYQAADEVCLKGFAFGEGGVWVGVWVVGCVGVGLLLRVSVCCSVVERERERLNGVLYDVETYI